MKLSKRAFIKAGTAMLVTVGITPIAANAGREGGVAIVIAASDGEQKSGGTVSLSKSQLAKLQKMDRKQKSIFLSEIIYHWLKKRFPKMAWAKVGSGISKDIARQTMKQFEGNGIGGEEKPLPKIKIRFKVKFKPPSNWEISLQIDL